MIRLAQIKLLERARAASTPDPAVFAEVLRRCGGVDAVETLTEQGYGRLMNHFTVVGFKCRQRPILSASTRKLVEEAGRQLGLTSHTYAADLRGYGGAADLRDFTGRGLIDLLSRWELRGLDVARFVACRRSVTPAQVRLIQLARKQTDVPNWRYYGMLQDFGGAVSANDLDGRGFDLAMAYLEALGFERAPVNRSARGFGRRPGFASPEQVELIRTLWREWIGPTADAEDAVEAGLSAWLERYHHVSSLRFLTASGGNKVITALRAMKLRSSKASAKCDVNPVGQVACD